MAHSSLTGRQAQIVQLLRQGQELSVEELAEHFSVSAMTIRRDLAQLQSRDQVVRTHGGAMLSRASTVKFSFFDKERSHAPLKRAIARQAARFVEPGMTLSLDTGTTNLEVARAITSIENIRVVTSSLAIASVLYTCENLELVLLGGTVRKNSPDLSGHLTEENLARFRVNLAFLGADGADEDGVYATDVGVVRVCQAMLAAAERVMLVADHSKFDSSQFVQYATWSQIDTLISDDGLGAYWRQLLQRHGVKLVTAAGESGG